jgi:hypothetical protein
MRPPLRRPGFPLAVALAGLAILSGCGGGDTQTMTKAQFVSAADQICKRAHDQFTAAQQNPPNTAQGTADLQRNLIDISENELQEIRDLEAPAEAQPALDRYLRAREQGIALLKKGLQAAENDDAQAYSAAMAKLATGQVQRLKLAQSVGFTECSRPGGASTGG